MMGTARDGIHAQSPHVGRGNDLRSQGTNTRAGSRADGRNGRSEDSWIEVASQPSSSSLSSAAANEEIVTTGLRIQRQQQHQQRRRRRPSRHRFNPQDIDINYARQPSSSQDEYEETESESDRLLSSSNEDIARQPRPDISFLPGTSSASEVALSSDDDDNSTALGLNSNTTTFTPQPNAFSHPPASQTSARSRTTAAGSAYTSSAQHGSRAGTRRNSRSGMHSARRLRHQQHQQQHSPYNMIAPSHQADNDAALRASLSTLLSCAAAARGLPKTDAQPRAPTATTAERNADEPAGFRLVPESVAMGDESRPDRHRAEPVRTPQSPLGITPSVRRRASPSKDRSTGQPSAKRSRRAGTQDASPVVSPTVMTWVISAGVVVLFSAISFSAGYVLGREVGRTETGQGFYGTGDEMSNMRTGTNCGKEAVRGGLRRFRWIGGGTGSGVSV